jgi:hypothetical protein
MRESSAPGTDQPALSRPPPDQPTWLWIGPRHGALSWPLELLRLAADGEGYGLLDPIDLSRQSLDAPQLVAQQLWPPVAERFEWQAIPRQQISRLIISSVDRTEPWWEWLSTVQNWFPQAQPMVLLGSWWEGHRRTEPNLPDISRWYWHQAFDRLGELIGGAGRARSATECHSMVLVLSPLGRMSSDRICMWQELLAGCDLQPLVLEGPAGLPTGSPVAVVVDHAEMPEPTVASEATVASGATVAACWSRLRQMYPHSWLISCRAFPRWDQWLADRRAGADRLLSQPFDAAGLSHALRQLGVRSRALSHQSE